NGSATVTTLTGCFWKPISNDDWIVVTSNGMTGSGSLSYTVLPNEGPARTGTITVATATFTVTQAAATCEFTIPPTGKFMDLVGSESSFELNGQAGCNWTAVASDDWITVTSGDSGSGPATIGFLVRDNFEPTPRQGTITIGGQVFTIVQD